MSFQASSASLANPADDSNTPPKFFTQPPTYPSTPPPVIYPPPQPLSCTSWGPSAQLVDVAVDALVAFEVHVNNNIGHSTHLCRSDIFDAAFEICEDHWQQVVEDGELKTLSNLVMLFHTHDRPLHHFRRRDSPLSDSDTDDPPLPNVTIPIPSVLPAQVDPESLNRFGKSASELQRNLYKALANLLQYTKLWALGNMCETHKIHYSNLWEALTAPNPRPRELHSFGTSLFPGTTRTSPGRATRCSTSASAVALALALALESSP